MKYGTLINGQPIHAPNPLHYGGRRIYNPPGDIYAAAGYFPIIETAYPEDDGYYTAHWEMRDGQIVRAWETAEPPAPVVEPPSMDDQRMDALESAVLELAEVMAGG